MYESNSVKKAGYVLHRVAPDMWQLQADYGTFKGNLSKVLTYAVQQLGFDFIQMETAVLEMNRQDHNAAEFGVMKKFMYSFNQGEPDVPRGTKIH